MPSIKCLGLCLALILNKSYFHFHFDWEKITQRTLVIILQVLWQGYHTKGLLVLFVFESWITKEIFYRRWGREDVLQGKYFLFFFLWWVNPAYTFATKDINQARRTLVLGLHLESLDPRSNKFYGVPAQLDFFLYNIRMMVINIPTYFREVYEHLKM